MKDNQTKERFVELRAEGRSYADIARELSFAKSTLIAWSRELEMEIANLRTIELDALYEKHTVAKRQRIHLFGTALEKLIDEFKKRDLSSVPTDKIFVLLLKYGAALKAEESETVFRAKSAWKLNTNLEEKVSWSA